jgi:hypothetical protein
MGSPICYFALNDTIGVRPWTITKNLLAVSLKKKSIISYCVLLSIITYLLLTKTSPLGWIFT